MHSSPTCLLKQQCHCRPIHLPAVSEIPAEFLRRCVVQTEPWMSPPTPTAGSSVNNKRRERSQVVTTVLLVIQIMWCMTPCRWVSFYRRLNGTCCFSSPRFGWSNNNCSLFQTKGSTCFRIVGKGQINYKTSKTRFFSILYLTTDPIHQGHEKRKKSVTSARSPRNTSAQLRDR